MIDVYEACEDCKGAPCPGVLFPVGEDGEPARVQVCNTCNGFAFELDAAEHIVELLDGPWRVMDTSGDVILVDGFGAPLEVSVARSLVAVSLSVERASED